MNVFIIVTINRLQAYVMCSMLIILKKKNCLKFKKYLSKQLELSMRRQFKECLSSVTQHRSNSQTATKGLSQDLNQPMRRLGLKGADKVCCVCCIYSENSWRIPHPSLPLFYTKTSSMCSQLTNFTFKLTPSEQEDDQN